MPEKTVRKPTMSSVEFVQDALRNHVAPPSKGSVKTRQLYAQRRLRWTENRIRDCWYARPWVSINADEIREIEETTGLRYARQELRTNEALIASATALLELVDEDFHGPVLSAFGEFLRALAGSRTER